MSEFMGTEYRRDDATYYLYLVMVVIIAGGGLFMLVRHGVVYGWFVILAVVWGIGMARSRTRPYAVVNAREITLWLSPMAPVTLPWSTMKSAHRKGVHIRLEQLGGKRFDVRWDSVRREMREQFVADIARHMGPRWTAGEHESGRLTRDARVEALRQWGVVAALAVVVAAVWFVLLRTGQIPNPWF